MSPEDSSPALPAALGNDIAVPDAPSSRKDTVLDLPSPAKRSAKAGAVDKRLLSEASHPRKKDGPPKSTQNPSGPVRPNGQKMPSKGVRDVDNAANTAAATTRKKPTWVTCAAAWTPLPVVSPLTWGLFLVFAVVYIASLLLTAPLPPVANPLVESILGVPLSPTFLPGQALPPPVTYVPALGCLMVGTSVFGAGPVLFLLGLTVITQWVFGVPLYAHMGSLPEGVIGPTWAYAIGLWAAIALTDRCLCTHAEKIPVKASGGAKRKGGWSLQGVASGGEIIRQKRESRRHTVLAKKQAARLSQQRRPSVRAIQGVAAAVWLKLGFMWQGVRAATLWCAAKFMASITPPVTEPLSLFRWGMQLSLATVLAVAAAHIIGSVGIVGWLLWHKVPTALWENWLSWPLNAALYDIPLTLATLFCVRPIRAMLRWLVY